jgi:hypothetical protein
VLGAVRVLGDAHRVDDRGALGRGESARRHPDLFGGHAGDLLDELRCVLGEHRGERIELLGALGDERLVVQPFGDDHVHKAVEERHIGARLELQVVVGAARHVDPPGVGDDQRGAGAHRLLEMDRGDRVRLARVGADDQDRLRRLEIGK